MKSNRIASKMRESVGTEIIESLSEFTEALGQGKVGAKLTCRKVRLRLVAKPYDRLQVKKTRRLLGLSQTLFSRFLGVSPNTVRAWEQGVNLPPAIACRFMDEIRRKPDFWKQRVQEEIITEG
jgi:putative transcriptional regulator